MKEQILENLLSTEISQSGIISKIKIGDRIEFKALTFYKSNKSIRKVNGFNRKGLPTVKFEGWEDFVLTEKEIIRIVK